MNTRELRAGEKLLTAICTNVKRDKSSPYGGEAYYELYSGDVALHTGFTVRHGTTKKPHPGDRFDLLMTQEDKPW